VDENIVELSLKDVVSKLEGLRKDVASLKKVGRGK
jgi:hypothetical protein